MIKDDANLSIGQLHQRAGARDAAEAYLGTSLTQLREMDMRFWAARAAEGLMGLGDLIVVARYNVPLYEYLKQEFAGESVTVVLDRRQGERRQRDEGPRAEERRRADRRRHAETDEALRTRGFVVIAGS